MSNIKAADLPVGSVVAKGSRVYLKDHTDSDLSWIYMEVGSMYTNFADDEDLDIEVAGGAKVLREGAE